MNEGKHIYLLNRHFGTGPQGNSRLHRRHFGTEVGYKGAPSFEYTVRDKAGREWRIAKDGRVITPELDKEGPDSALEVFKTLAEASAGADGCAASVVLPVAGHNGITLRNLINIIASKQELIFKALCINEQFAFKHELVDALNLKKLDTVLPGQGQQRQGLETDERRKHPAGMQKRGSRRQAQGGAGQPGLQVRGH